MNKKEWQALDQARDLLKLGDRATLGEMKRAYHQMCKQHHPDRSGDEAQDSEVMYRLTEDYDLLMRYTNEYRSRWQPRSDRWCACRRLGWRTLG